MKPYNQSKNYIAIYTLLMENKWRVHHIPHAIPKYMSFKYYVQPVLLQQSQDEKKD